MSWETTVMLFVIVIPFAIFAGVLGWAQSRTKLIERIYHRGRFAEASRLPLVRQAHGARQNSSACWSAPRTALFPVRALPGSLDNFDRRQAIDEQLRPGLPAPHTAPGQRPAA
jgi:hypothetical protein